MDAAHYLAVLRAGGVVACATETQTGLLADALDEGAVERVYALKGRPAGEPIGVLVPSLDHARALAVELTPLAEALARAHWPGPLTLVVRARAGLPAALLKDGKLALRVPGPSPALDLVTAFDGPLTATSANKSGEPAACTPAEVRAAFGERVDAIVPGDAPGGPPSTLVDVTEEAPRVLRRGAISL